MSFLCFDLMIFEAFTYMFILCFDLMIFEKKYKKPYSKSFITGRPNIY